MLHLWFWSTKNECDNCQVKSDGGSKIRAVFKEMFINDETPAYGGWCRNKTRQLDAYMRNLTGPDVNADNPQLLTVLRRHVIDPPSPYLVKMSYPLFKTPQAEAVSKLTKGKVNKRLEPKIINDSCNPTSRQNALM